MRYLVVALAVTMAAGLALPSGAEACGGRTAYILDDTKALPRDSVEARGPGGIPYYVAREGHVLLPAKAVKVSSALAEAIARRYLAKTYGAVRHLEFEAFTFEHGAFVYMYHAQVPDLAASYHVGPLRFVTHDAHVHVDAITGDVYGFGCGGGPGIVDMPFDPKAYPAAARGKRLPYVQFDSHFRAREGALPRIDGRIEEAEWADAGHEVVIVGTDRSTITEYG